MRGPCRLGQIDSFPDRKNRTITGDSPSELVMEGIMNGEVRGLLVPLELDASELNDLRCLRAAEGYAELGMYEEADAELESLVRGAGCFICYCAQALCRCPVNR